MNNLGFTYVVGDSALHRLDARVKIAVLFVFSIAIFFANEWWSMAGFVVVTAIAAVIARIPVKRLVGPLVPVIVLAAFTGLFLFVASPDVHGLYRGLVVAVRMITLVAASVVVCLTTTSTQLVAAFAWFIGPLRALRVPVDDIAFTLSLALRFIPVIAEEFNQVRRAQIARGGSVDGVPFRRKLQIWGAAFSAVFIGLFRHADTLASAMDARCYGAADRRLPLK